MIVNDCGVKKENNIWREDGMRDGFDLLIYLQEEAERASHRGHQTERSFHAHTS